MHIKIRDWTKRLDGKNSSSNNNTDEFSITVIEKDLNLLSGRSTIKNEITERRIGNKCDESRGKDIFFDLVN